MYAKSRILSCLIVCFPAVSGFSQVDTLARNEVYAAHLRVNIRTIGLVENNIMYASQAIDGDDVVIIDVSTVLTGGMYHDSVVLDTIPRSGATTRETGAGTVEVFPFLKVGNTILFNDGATLRIYDVSDPRNAVLKHSVDTGEEIYGIAFRNDSLFVNQSPGNDLIIYTYDFINPPSLVSNLDQLGGGGIYLNDKYYILNDGAYTVWTFPLSSRAPEWFGALPGFKNRAAMVYRGNHAFGTGSLGTIVMENVNDFDNFRAIDTLPGGFGEYIVLHKNLLIVAKDNGGDEDVDIFDVSDVNNIRHVAYWGSPAGGIAVDPATNYLYLEIETGENSEWFDMIDLTPYVDEPAKSISLTSPSASTKWEKGSTQTITWSSTGYIDEVALEYNLGGGWEVITASTPNDGSYAWTVPDSASNTVTVRITDEYGQVTVESEEFAIEPPLGVVTREGSRGFRFIRSVRGMEFYVPETYKDLTIYDLRGQHVRSLPVSAGSAHWDGKDRSGNAVQKGLYIARLQSTGGAVAVRFAVY